MALPKRSHTGNHLQTEVWINVFDLKEKGKILFTGNVTEVAHFVGVAPWNVYPYLKRKNRCKKKYALRYAKTTNQ